MGQKVKAGENGTGRPNQKAVSSLGLDGLSSRHDGREAARGILCARETWQMMAWALSQEGLGDL